jgi:tetratricopeptide (TPR) repeat protein
LLELGIAYRDANRLRDAEACLREALSLSEKQPPDRDHRTVVEQLALLLNNLGLAAQEQRRFEEALSRFEESARLCKTLGSLPTLAGVLKNIGNTHWLAGARDQALAAYAEALAGFDGDSDRSEAIELLCTMAEMETACGRIDDALRNYSDAWARCAGSEEREYVRDRLDDLAARSASGFHPHFALDLYRACLRFNEEAGNETGAAAVQFNIAALLMHLGRPAEALPLLRRAAKTFERHAHPGLEDARALLARCDADLTRLSGASELDAE